MQVGPIEGSGPFQIDGGVQLRFVTGSLGTSTRVSGAISGRFAPLSMVGDGTLMTLSQR